MLDKIVKFVYWLGHQNKDENNVMMQFDEIVGELMLEIAKGLSVYAGKPEGQMLAILRKMCDNRIAELKSKHYGTHRKLGANPVRLGEPVDEGDECVDVISKDIGPSQLSESIERVMATRHLLSDTSKRVFDSVILYDNGRVGSQIELSGMRAKAVFKGGGSVRLKPWHVAEALMLSESTVKNCFKDIKESYARVCEDQAS